MQKRRILLVFAVMAALVLVSFSTDNASAGKWKRKSQEHEAACKAWCDAHPGDCDHCSTKSGCGQGFDTIQSWTGYGKNWHACKKRLSRKEAAEARREECEAWCRRNPDCIKCRSAAGGCISGLVSLKKWRGRGTNYWACGKKKYRRPASNWNREECLKWCDDNKPLCRKCASYKGCAAGFIAIKSWKGRGKNFHACADRDEVKAKNKADCEAWCAEHPDECVECKTSKNCGKDLSNLKTFNLGKSSRLDYHACKVRTANVGVLDPVD